MNCQFHHCTAPLLCVRHGECVGKPSSESKQRAQAATWPFPADLSHWRERALKAEARLAELEAAVESCTAENRSERKGR